MKKIELTKDQRTKVRKGLEYLSTELGIAYEIEHGYESVQRTVFAFLAGWLSDDDMQFSAVYEMANEFCRKVIDV